MMADYTNIPLNMTKEEQRFLITHAQEAKRGMVELGACWGKSSIDLGRIARIKELPMICVDTWEDDNFYNGWVQNIEDAGLTDDITPLRMSSYDACPVVGKNYKNKIDFIFIDADHSYEAIKADFENWSPLLALPAIVVFHDIDVSCFGVKQFYGELCRKYKHAEQDNIGAIFLSDQRRRTTTKKG